VATDGIRIAERFEGLKQIGEPVGTPLVDMSGQLAWVLNEGTRGGLWQTCSDF
jgi:hypothetical protein